MILCCNYGSFEVKFYQNFTRKRLPLQCIIVINRKNEMDLQYMHTGWKLSACGRMITVQPSMHGTSCCIVFSFSFRGKKTSLYSTKDFHRPVLNGYYRLVQKVISNKHWRSGLGDKYSYCSYIGNGMLKSCL